MKSRRGNLPRIVTLMGALALATEGWAGMVFDEASLSDFSNDGNAPSAFEFGLGANRVVGTMGRPPGMPVDSDIFTFTIGEGQQLTSIFIDVMEPAESSFLAIAAGRSIRTNVTDPSDGGRSHLSNLLTRDVGEQIFALAGAKEFGGTTSGLTAPAGPGDYTIWFQETSTRVDYELVLTVVPEPGAVLLVGLGGALVAGLRWWEGVSRRGRRGEFRRG